MKNNVKMLVRVGFFLMTPMAFAIYGKRPMQFSAEMRSQVVNVSWHTVAVSRSQHLDAYTTAITNASGYSFQEAGDRVPKVSLGGRFGVKTKYASDLTVMVALGMELGLRNGKGYRPIDPAGDGVAVTVSEWDAQAEDSYAKWTNGLVLAPAVFVGYGALAVGVELDAREYRIEGHEASNIDYLNKRVRDHQVLYGFRGEQTYNLGHGKFLLSFEVMSNLGKEADKETKEYFQNLAKYGTDYVMTDSSGVLDNSTGLTGVGAQALPATRALVSSVNTKFTKASLGMGVMFADF